MARSAGVGADVARRQAAFAYRSQAYVAAATTGGVVVVVVDVEVVVDSDAAAAVALGAVVADSTFA